MSISEGQLVRTADGREPMRYGIVVQTRVFGVRVAWTTSPWGERLYGRDWQSWHGYSAVEPVNEVSANR